jgi:periplasmic protein TonB
MSAIPIPKPSFIATNRNVVIAGSVLLFHALAIWALQTGLLMRAVEIIVPVEVLAQIIDLPTPKTAQPVPTPTPLVPVKQAVTKLTPITQTAPPILTVNEPAPVATAFVAPTPQPPAPIAPQSVPVAAVPAPAESAKVSASTPACVQDYISQPDPIYPRPSRSLGEQGIAEIRVLFSAAGVPLKAEIVKSSGYERLDKAALEGTKRWRFVTCSGIAAAVDHWKETPVTFKLN